MTFRIYIGCPVVVYKFPTLLFDGFGLMSIPDHSSCGASYPTCSRSSFAVVQNLSEIAPWDWERTAGGKHPCQKMLSTPMNISIQVITCRESANLDFKCSM